MKRHCPTVCRLRAHAMLSRSGLRATEQRINIASILFCGPDRHVSAEALYRQAKSEGLKLSLATVYNTLHQFCSAGLLREIAIDATQSFFDTNTSNHSHFYDEHSGQLLDIDGDVQVVGIPNPPEGFAVKHIDVVVRLATAANVNVKKPGGNNILV